MEPRADDQQSECSPFPLVAQLTCPRRRAMQLQTGHSAHDLAHVLKCQIEHLLLTSVLQKRRLAREWRAPRAAVQHNVKGSGSDKGSWPSSRSTVRPRAIPTVTLSTKRGGPCTTGRFNTAHARTRGRA